MDIAANAEAVAQAARKRKRLSITSLLRPHFGTLALGLIAITGESIANLLEPWPLKIVLDDVLAVPSEQCLGDANCAPFSGQRQVGNAQVRLRRRAGNRGIRRDLHLRREVPHHQRRPMGEHDLRRTLYAHIQRLSLAYHDQKQTGDLISRVTSDIDAVQSFI